MSTAVVSAIAKKKKKPKCPSTINGKILIYVCTIESYRVMTVSHLQLHTATWVNPTV